MRLSETKCRNATLKDKIYKLSDGRGLYLVMPKRGNKRWEFRYQFAQKAKTISLGLYPDVSLEKARQKREEARKLRNEGIDPSQQRKIEKLQNAENNRNTFEAIATSWYDSRKNDWSENYQVNALRMLKKVYPYIGNKPIRDIIPNDLLKGILEIESKGHVATAKKTLQYVNRVYKFAIRRGYLQFNIADVLHEDLTASKTKHRPAMIEPEEVGQLMLDIDSCKDRAAIQIYQSLRLLAFTFVRPCEARNAQWFEINWEEKQWKINAQKTKMGKKEENRDDHIVPLSRQALEILHEMYDTFSKGVDFKGDEYIFPSTIDFTKPLSKSTMNGILHNLGYKGQHCTHGFRAMARTLLDERLGFRIDWIEHQLAHKVKDALGRAYNRTKHLSERREMMQAYADYLDKLKAEAEAKTKEAEESNG